MCLSYLQAKFLENAAPKRKNRSEIVAKGWVGRSMSLFRGVVGREKHAVRSTMPPPSDQNTCMSILPVSVCLVIGVGQATGQSVLEIGV